MLELSHVTTCGRNFTLKDISFQVPVGYITGLVGKNGAGKSTLMRLILDLIRRNSGSITLDGIDNIRQGSAFRDMVGFVSGSEEPFLMGKSALKNGEILGACYSNWQPERFLSYLKQFGIGATKAKHKLSQLSQGQFIRFQLAFALAHKPRLLLLDEPTANLDPVFRMEFLQLLQEVIESEEVGILFATHITSDLDKIGDYIVVLDEGKIVTAKTKDELLEEYRVTKLSEALIQLARGNLNE